MHKISVISKMVIIHCKAALCFINKSDFQTWSPHFFVLTSTKLYYSEERSNENDDDIDDDETSMDGMEVNIVCMRHN